MTEQPHLGAPRPVLLPPPACVAHGMRCLLLQTKKAGLNTGRCVATRNAAAVAAAVHAACGLAPASAVPAPARWPRGVDLLRFMYCDARCLQMVPSLRERGHAAVRLLCMGGRAERAGTAPSRRRACDPHSAFFSAAVRADAHIPRLRSPHARCARRCRRRVARASAPRHLDASRRPCPLRRGVPVPRGRAGALPLAAHARRRRHVGRRPQARALRIALLRFWAFA